VRRGKDVGGARLRARAGAAGLSSAGELESAARLAGGHGRGAWRHAGGEGEAQERRNGGTAAADVEQMRKKRKNGTVI
jgi:hypothetical protein